VLVTGATGFIAGALLRRLAQWDVRLVCLRHSQSAPDWLACPQDAQGMRRLVQEQRPEIIFHLAGSRLGANPHDVLQKAMHANLQLTHFLLEACWEFGVQSFVYAGTAAEYGPGAVPFQEDQPVAPVSPYAVSKLCGTLLTQQYGQHCGLNTCSARICLAYGPGQGEDLFLAGLMRAWRSGVPLAMSPGGQTRDFVWVEDCVEALLRLGLERNLQGSVVNVCTGIETPLRDVVSLLGSLSGRDPHVQVGALPYREGEMMRYVGNPERLERITGYRPSTSLETGLRFMLEAEK